MNKKEILRIIESTVSEVLDIEPIRIKSNSSTDSINGWDSLAHINIILQIEQYFQIKFTLEEISKFNSINKIVDSIERKYKQK